MAAHVFFKAAGPPGIPVLKVKNYSRQPSKFLKIPIVKSITFLYI